MWLPAMTLVAASCVTVAVVAVDDSARAVVKTSVPGVWLANDAAASVSHVGQDGVDATVPLDRQTGALRVIQVDGTAYVTDDSGRVSRIDPAQLAVAQEAMLPSSGSRLVAGGGRLYAVDTTSGTVRQLDPVQLTSIGQAVTVARPLGAAVVDPSGVLWVNDIGAGDIVAVDGRTVGTRAKVTDPDVPVQLSVVGAAVVVVDARKATVTVVKNRQPSAPRPLTTEPGATIEVPDAVPGGVVLPLTSGNRSLVLIDVDTGRVRTVDLGVEGHKLGAPRVSSAKAYVPDYTAGSVLVVDLATAQLTRTVAVTGKAGTFDLVTDDTSVYVNDPGSERAWTLNDAGEAVPASKYDPKSPRDGGRGVQVVPPAPTVPPPGAPGAAVVGVVLGDSP